MKTKPIRYSAALHTDFEHLPAIRTSRLTIFPLTADEFVVQAPLLDAGTRAALEGLYAMRTSGAEWFWYAYWKMCRDEDEWVGGLCFMGAPENGEAEIGYGLVPCMEKRGYMTEALNGVCAWLKSCGCRVLLLRAGCEVQNNASAAVLIRCGFVREKTEDKIEWFVRDLSG